MKTSTEHLSPAEAISRLRAGNRRFASGSLTVTPPPVDTEQAEPVTPLSVVLSCSDARVPTNLVFDCGIGEIFSVRVAGNVAAPTPIDSIEFAVNRLGANLVVVLGHSGCGAVTQAIEELRKPAHRRTTRRPSIAGIVRPVVKAVMGTAPDASNDELLPRAVHANVRESVATIRSAPGLRRAVATGQLAVVGAEYSLETRLVTFHPQDLDIFPARANCA